MALQAHRELEENEALPALPELMEQMVTSETQLQVKESGSMVPKVRKEGLEHLELEAVEVGTDQQESMLQELKGLAAYLDSMEFKANRATRDQEEETDIAANLEASEPPAVKVTTDHTEKTEETVQQATRAERANTVWKA